jgi:hypothetical protein
MKTILAKRLATLGLTGTLLAASGCSSTPAPTEGRVTTSAATGYGTQIFSGTYKEVGYSRAIKLADGSILAAFTVEYATNSGAIRVYRSTNNGSSFAFLTEFTDNGDGWQIGCPTIFETSPGTVLLAYNKFNDNAFEQGQKLKIVKSTNNGSSWSAPATIETGVWNWEPEFARSSDGKLQLYYSYAPTLKANNLSMFDQVIVRRESGDNGSSWGTRITAVGNANDNVGMPRIVKAGSTYHMAFEYYDDGGAVRLASSSDGKTWTGTSAWKTMETSSGWMFSTPALTALGSTLIGTGKVYKDAIWGDDGNNGKVVLYSKDGGSTWKEMDSPFIVVFKDDDSNWSPTLLPLSSTSLFMITASDNLSVTTERFGTGPISTP